MQHQFGSIASDVIFVKYPYVSSLEIKTCHPAYFMKQSTYNYCSINEYPGSWIETLITKITSFVGLHLYSEEKNKWYHVVTNIISICIYIEMVNLIDGDYELVPANTATPESVGVYRQACSGIPLAVRFVGRDRLL